MYGRGVPGGALNPNSTGYPDDGRYGDLPLQGKTPKAEPRIDPGTSWLVVRSSDHQATKLVPLYNLYVAKGVLWVDIGFSMCLFASCSSQFV
jgi:hypothetical protein